MTRPLSRVRLQQIQRIASELETELEDLQPLLKQTHLLASNAISSAARAGTEGDPCRVLLQAIQSLLEDIKKQLTHVQRILLQVCQSQANSDIPTQIQQLEQVFTALMLVMRQGDCLVISLSVEAAHAPLPGDGLASVISTLKQLVSMLRQKHSQQQAKITELLKLI